MPNPLAPVPVTLNHAPLTGLWAEMAADPAWQAMQRRGYLSDRLVPGTGNPRADAAFVGEAPGRQEDEQGRPFVGQAGDVLWRELEAVTGLRRDAVWITNVVKFRPHNNATPGLYESRIGARYLRRELAIIRPRVVVLLGSVPLKLMKPGTTITAEHGQPFERDPKDGHGSTRIYLPVYHPAYLLRRRDLLPEFRDDLRLIPELLAQKENQS